MKSFGGADYDWISELLDDKVGDREADDSDDIVFVGEAMMNPKSRSKSSSVVENDLDDDCVALDGDPDKSVEIENSNASDSDDRGDTTRS
ncbi:poly(A)-specific ribonuclease [Sarracenia purpurea var. burkii]